MIWPALIELIALSPLIVVIAFVFLKAKQLDRDDRRDPITTELRLLPGNSLDKQIERLADSRIDKLVIAMSIGLFTALLISTRRMDLTVHPLDWVDISFILLAIFMAVRLGRQIAGDIPLQRKLKQAVRAEQATAQELASSLSGDSRIIHDIQAKGFNIDHVVITPAGVFAIETKSRLKPPAGNGTSAVKVRYDGKQLEFPNWTETKPIEQAARQAAWLSDYLRQATGESFPVTPALALPGWYIEFTTKLSEGMVRVFNPRKSSWLLLPDKQPARLDAAAIQRAANAVEKLAQIA